MINKINQNNFVPYITEKTVYHIENKYPWVSSSSLTKEIQSLSPTQIKQFVDGVVSQILFKKNFLTLIERFSQIIPDNLLEKDLKANIFQQIKTRTILQNEAKHDLEITKGKSISLKQRIDSGTHKLLYSLEKWLDFFGIAEYLNPSEAKEKWQKTTLLIGLYSLLCTTLIPLASTIASPILIYGILLGISALTLLYPYVRPMPYQIPHMTNWTLKFKEGDLFSAPCRKNTVDNIASNLSTHKHLLLLGKSGVGKTSLIKMLTKEIVEGTYPELQGKQVFYINAANIENSDSSTKRQVLNQISACMEGHRENIILVFDEAHAIYQSPLQEQLKTMLDDPKSHFPYVIAITTEEEYKKDPSLTQSPFAKRFKQIDIQKAPKEEMLKILKSKLLAQAPGLIVEKEAFLHLIEQAEKHSICPIKLLTECIQKCQEIPLKNFEIETLKTKLLISDSEPVYALEEENKLIHELSQLQDQQIENQKITSILFAHREQIAEIKQEAKKSLLHLSKRKFLLLNHIALPMLEKAVNEESKKIGIHSTIDRALIDETLSKIFP